MSRLKRCFVCNASLQIGQIRTVDNLFFAPPKISNQPPTESLATILSDVLDRDILGSDTHSDVLCKKCQQNCVEYDRLSKRLEILRQTISDNYQETKQKYEMEETIEIDSGNSLVEHSDLSNMYAIETVDQNMGEVFDNSPSNDSNEPETTKKVILIKSENDFQSYFAVAEIDESDDGTGHTDSTATINYGLDEDITQQYVIAGPSSDPKAEKFLTNTDQMIEIDTSDDFPDSDQYLVFHDANDPLNENIEDVVADPGAVILEEDSTKKRMHAKKVKFEEDEQRQLFVRDGLQYQCILCEPATEVIYDTKTIAIHLKTDHNEKIYVCDICGCDFHKRTQYNEHVNDHSTLHECEVCKAVFTEVRDYRLHKKTHSSNEKVWACKICEKKYNSRKLLDEHMNMHTGER